MTSKAKQVDTTGGAKTPDLVDPLDIGQAFATRKAMSIGSKVKYAQLVAGGQSLSDKIAILLRYLRCRAGPGNLSPEEFLKFGLDQTGVDDIHRFVGHAAQMRMHDACNDASWFATTKNKLLWEMIMAGAGLRVPETLAVYEKKGRGGGVMILHDGDALTDFLSRSSNIPVFCKPVTGVYSIGAFRIDAFDGEKALINGLWKKSVEEIAGYFEVVGKKGYLLQRPLMPNKKLFPATGNSIATLRFLLRMDGGNPSLMRCVLKVPAKGEVADNFWRPEAQLCAVAVGSGEVTDKIVNDGSQKYFRVSGNSNAFPPPGFVMPDYKDAKQLLCEGARHFPGIRTQSWDIAVTDEGPVLMELNFGGDLGLAQLAHRKGILNEEYCNHLRKCGYKGKLPG